MNKTQTAWGRIRAIAFGAMVVALAATAALLGQQSTAAPTTRFDTTRGVLLSSRENLKVCVEPEPSDVLGAALGRVRAALVRLNGDAWFRAGAFDTPAWHVAPRCPTPGRLLASGQRHAKAGGSYVSGPAVSNPSPFRLFIYVVPSAEIVRMFGSLPFHHAGQEIFCEKGTCATVTTALYVDAATLANEDQLTSEIEQALGLRAAYPASPGALPPRGTK